jgi:hypothetical protein
MKRLTLLSFLGLLVIIIIVAFSQSPNKYLDYKDGIQSNQSSKNGCCSGNTNLAMGD